MSSSDASSPAVPPDVPPDVVVAGCTALVGSSDAGAVFAADVDIEITGNAITAVVAHVRPDRRAPTSEVVDATGLVAIPGLINGHTHAAMSLLRGAAEDVSTHSWFNDHIWQMEVNVTEHDVYLGTLLAAAEMIESGVTMFNDHYFFMDAAAQAVQESGIRAGLGSTFFSSQGPDGLAQSTDFAQRMRGAADGRITTFLAPHATYTCTDDDLAAAADAARALGVRVHVHAAEAIGQTESSLATRGITPIAVLDETGVLDAGAVIAHGNGIVASDVPLLAAHRDRVGIPVSPKGYLKHAHRVLTPIRALRAAGVQVGMGTDGAASNNNHDVLESMRMTALSQKMVEEDATWLSTGIALEMATTASAAVVGLDGVIGSLAAGCRADIALLDLSGLHCRPMHDLAAALVYNARASDVRTTIVDGRIVMRDRVILTIDRAALLAEVDERAAFITDRSHGGSIQSYAP